MAAPRAGDGEGPDPNEAPWLSLFSNLPKILKLGEVRRQPRDTCTLATGVERVRLQPAHWREGCIRKSARWGPKANAPPTTTAQPA